MEEKIEEDDDHSKPERVKIIKSVGKSKSEETVITGKMFRYRLIQKLVLSLSREAACIYCFRNIIKIPQPVLSAYSTFTVILGVSIILTLVCPWHTLSDFLFGFAKSEL